MHDVISPVHLTVSCCTQQQETQAQVVGYVKKNQALANALHHQGRTSTALHRLGNALALLASLSLACTRSGQPLVLMLVTFRASLQSTTIMKAASKPGSRSGNAQMQLQLLTKRNRQAVHGLDKLSDAMQSATKSCKQAHATLLRTP